MHMPSHIAAESLTADHAFMKSALALGRRHMGQTDTNPSVGALVVKEGVVLGRGVTALGGRPHAEVLALSEAGAAARGGTLYVTLEPCSHHGKTPPCVDAIIAAGIVRVVVSVDDPDPRVDGAGYARLREAGIEVVRGILAAEGRRDLGGHILRHTRNRPYVTLKLALSEDGYIAGPDRKPIRITCDMASRFVHLMRAQHTAILVGIATVLADDPLLTCRLDGLTARSPHRVVLDPDLRMPIASRLVATARTIPLTVFTSPMGLKRAESLSRQPGVKVRSLDDLPSALLEEGGTRLMLEGGAETARRFLASGWVDEAVILVNPAMRLLDGVSAFPRDRFFYMREYLESCGLALQESFSLGETALYRYASQQFAT